MISASLIGWVLFDISGSYHSTAPVESTRDRVIHSDYS